MICDDRCFFLRQLRNSWVSNDCNPLHCPVQVTRSALRRQPSAVWQNWSLSLTSLTCLTCLTVLQISFLPQSFPSLVLPSAACACQMFHLKKNSWLEVPTPLPTGRASNTNGNFATKSGRARLWVAANSGSNESYESLLF